MTATDWGLVFVAKEWNKRKLSCVSWGMKMKSIFCVGSAVEFVMYVNEMLALVPWQMADSMLGHS